MKMSLLGTVVIGSSVFTPCLYVHVLSLMPDDDVGSRLGLNKQ